MEKKPSEREIQDFAVLLSSFQAREVFWQTWKNLSQALFHLSTTDRVNLAFQ